MAGTSFLTRKGERIQGCSVRFSRANLDWGIVGYAGYTLHVLQGSAHAIPDAVLIHAGTHPSNRVDWRRESALRWRVRKRVQVRLTIGVILEPLL